ncbi:uncharacterized protein LOC143198159 [Rhynchophorus ferrugineus]|uniref:uncharacterized protein LOC143198159 n=1 Tax=Rhynchophorus ferrugineus TaxID=354439 RepID=UPI003FCD5C81
MRVETVLLLATLLNAVLSLPLTAESKRTNATNARQAQDPKLPTLTQPAAAAKDPLTDQTENIRQIIAAEKRSHEQQQRGKELNLSNLARKPEASLVDVGEERYVSVEEFRNKCQHFSRLFGLGNKFPDTHSTASTMTSSKPETSTDKPSIIEVTRRPVYIRNKPTFIQKTNGGFYVTATSATRDEISTTKRPHWMSSTVPPAPSAAYISSTGPPITSTIQTIKTFLDDANNHVDKDILSPIKVRYTKFEPVILQKTILSDGRILYHWHKSLPTTAIGIPAPIAQIIPPYEVSPELLSTTKNTAQEAGNTAETTTTTTTTEKSSWLFVPFSSFFGGSHEDETTVETTSPTTPTSSPSPQTTASNVSVKLTANNPSTDDVKLQHQFKFVIPVHYDDIDAQNKPPEYDSYQQYLPKRPATAVTAQPPSLPIIKSLAVPQRYGLAYTAPGYGLALNSGLYNRYPVNYASPYPTMTLDKQGRNIEDVAIEE